MVSKEACLGALIFVGFLAQHSAKLSQHSAIRAYIHMCCIAFHWTLDLHRNSSKSGMCMCMCKWFYTFFINFHTFFFNFRTIFATFWGRFGRFWGVWREACEKYRKAHLSGGLLEAIWAPRCAKLEPRWRQVGQLGAKMCPRWPTWRLRWPTWRTFGSILATFFASWARSC